MTNQELNRDIKRLAKTFKELYGNNRTDEQSEAMRKEFLRLYRADDAAEVLNIYSLKTMMRINQAMRYTPLHNIYINIEI